MSNPGHPYPSAGLPPRLLILALGFSCFLGCGGDRTSTDAVERHLARLSLPPDIEELDPPVQRQLRQRWTRLEAALSNPATETGLEERYGDLGKVYYAYGYFDRALTCFDRAAELADDPSPWNHVAGHAFLALNQPRTAVDRFESVLERHPADLPARVRLAETFLGLGELPRAEQHFADAVARDARSARAWYGLGQAQLQQRKPRLALDSLYRAAELQPRASPVRYALASAHRELGDLDAATAELQRVPSNNLVQDQVVLIDPLMAQIDELDVSARAHDLRALRAAAAGQFDLAAIEYRQAMIADPDHIWAGYGLGHSLYRTGRGDEALTALESVLERAPGHTPSRVLAAEILVDAGRLGEAEAQLDVAISGDAGSAQAHRARGEIHLVENRCDKALRDLDLALRLDPDLVAAHFARWTCRARLHGVGEADSGLAETSPRIGATDLRLLRSRLLAATPSAPPELRAEALATARELVQNRGNVSDHETLALALAGRGDFGEASAIQARLAEIFGDERQPTPGWIDLRLRSYRRSEVPLPWLPGERLVHRMVDGFQEGKPES